MTTKAKPALTECIHCHHQTEVGLVRACPMRKRGRCVYRPVAPEITHVSIDGEEYEQDEATISKSVA